MFVLQLLTLPSRERPILWMKRETSIELMPLRETFLDLMVTLFYLPLAKSPKAMTSRLHPKCETIHVVILTRQYGKEQHEMAQTKN